MFRFLGFVGGIVFLFIIGASSKGSTSQAFLALGVLDLITIFFIIMFRLLTNCSTEIDKVYSERLGQAVSKASACCCGITILPQTTYKTTTFYSDGTSKVQYSQTCNTCCCGILQASIFFAFTFVFPVIIIYLLILYAMAIVGICTQSTRKIVYPERFSNSQIQM